jgi:hypothetical protein
MVCMGHQYLDSAIRLEILKKKLIASAIIKLNVTHPVVFVLQEEGILLCLCYNKKVFYCCRLHKLRKGK